MPFSFISFINKLKLMHLFFLKKVNRTLTRLGYFYVTAILSWGYGWGSVEVDIEHEVDLNLRLKWGWDEIE